MIGSNRDRWGMLLIVVLVVLALAGCRVVETATPVATVDPTPTREVVLLTPTLDDLVSPHAWCAGQRFAECGADYDGCPVEILRRCEVNPNPHMKPKNGVYGVEEFQDPGNGAIRQFEVPAYYTAYLERGANGVAPTARCFSEGLGWTEPDAGCTVQIEYTNPDFAGWSVSTIVYPDSRYVIGVEGTAEVQRGAVDLIVEVLDEADLVTAYRWEPRPVTGEFSQAYVFETGPDVYNVLIRVGVMARWSDTRAMVTIHTISASAVTDAYGGDVVRLIE
jgi:hypothetical protein